MRMPPPLIALVTGVLMYLAAHYLHLLRLSFPFETVAAAAVMLIGFAFAVLSFRAFGRAATTVSPVHVGQASTLVTTGTYAITRNPMYLGLLLIVTGWFIYLGEGVNAVFPAGFVAVITFTQIRREERALRQIFGTAYIEYCRKVRRWL